MSCMYPSIREEKKWAIILHCTDLRASALLVVVARKGGAILLIQHSRYVTSSTGQSTYVTVVRPTTASQTGQVCFEEQYSEPAHA